MTDKSSPNWRQKVAFTGDNGFQTALRKRIDEFFADSGHARAGSISIYIKSGVILMLFAVLYVLLVFQADSLPVGLLLALALGLTAAAVGVNIQHDAGHGSFSTIPWVNKMGSMTLDLIGGSSYVWRWKHTRFHHTFVNVTDYDADLDMGGIGRVTPYQKQRWFHRWQHLYMWPMYSLLAIKWQVFDDFAAVALGRLGTHSIPRPKGWDLVLFAGGKALFVVFAFVVPLLVRPWEQVLAFYLLVSMIAGICLSMIFILPHTVEESIFPLVKGSDAHLDTSRAEHQARVTADFERGSKIFTGLVGGLNFHREHHLFPAVCHTYTPALAPIIDNLCEEYGVTHVVHRSYASGIKSHYRLLQRMGRGEE